MLSTEVVLKVAHAVVYLILLGVGIYFIEQGDIVEKFSERKTNFAETLGGQITELPTIVTLIEPLHGDLKLGVDFNISYAIAVRFNHNPNLAEDDTLVNLVEGTNVLDAERQIAIYFETVLHGNVYKISPISGQINVNAYYGIIYTFKNSSYDKNTLREAVFHVSNENSSVSWVDSSRKTIDGEALIYSVPKGLGVTTSLRPEKIQYLEDISGCRTKPYNEILFSEVSDMDLKNSQKKLENCSKVCRPGQNYYGKNLEKIIAKFPICTNKSDENCFYKLIEKAREKIIVQPCTKVQYRGQDQKHSLERGNKMITFFYNFDSPQRMRTYKEYLIYDGFAMIGAIGGTLGLFIGFSFSDFIWLVLTYFSSCLNKFKHPIKDENDLERFGSQVDRLRNDIEDIKSQIMTLKNNTKLSQQ